MEAYRGVASTLRPSPRPAPTHLKGVGVRSGARPVQPGLFIVQRWRSALGCSLVSWCGAGLKKMERGISVWPGPARPPQSLLCSERQLLYVVSSPLRRRDVNLFTTITLWLGQEKARSTSDSPPAEQADSRRGLPRSNASLGLDARPSQEYTPSDQGSVRLGSYSARICD